MVNRAVEMIGTGRVKGADLYTAIVTELHIARRRRSAFACRCRDAVYPGTISNDMQGGIIVYKSEHASLGNGDRGLDEVGTLCMDGTWAVTGGPAFPTADDERAEQSQYHQYNQPLFHNQWPFFFYTTPKGKVSVYD